MCIPGLLGMVMIFCWHNMAAYFLSCHQTTIDILREMIYFNCGVSPLHDFFFFWNVSSLWLSSLLPPPFFNSFVDKICLLCFCLFKYSIIHHIIDEILWLYYHVDVCNNDTNIWHFCHTKTPTHMHENCWLTTLQVHFVPRSQCWHRCPCISSYNKKQICKRRVLCHSLYISFLNSSLNL